MKWIPWYAAIISLVVLLVLLVVKPKVILDPTVPQTHKNLSLRVHDKRSGKAFSNSQMWWFERGGHTCYIVMVTQEPNKSTMASMSCVR